MPPALTKAHPDLDAAADRRYRREPFKADRDRVEYLFALYKTLATPLVPPTMAEQAHAVRVVLTAGPGTAAEIAKRFKRAKVESVTEILDTLATLGQAHREGAVYRAI